MFEDWKEAWRQAVENFQREAALEGGPSGPHVRVMERELTTAAGALGKIDDEIRRVQHELVNEREQEAICRRREGLAREAQDEVTVQIAVEYAARHAARVAVLERKSSVLVDERDLLATDLAAMRKIMDEAPAVQSVSATAEDPPKTEAGKHDDHAFTRMERDVRERDADERLEELKKKMRG